MKLRKLWPALLGAAISIGIVTWHNQAQPVPSQSQEATRLSGLCDTMAILKLDGTPFVYGVNVKVGQGDLVVDCGTPRVGP